MKKTCPINFWQRCALHTPRRRQYLRIYCSFVAVLLAFSMLVGWVIWSVIERKMHNASAPLAALIEQTLPANSPLAATQQTLQSITEVSGHKAALYGADGHLIAAVGNAPAYDDGSGLSSYRLWQAGMLKDGRRLVFDWKPLRGDHLAPFGWLAAIVLLAAIGALPIARRLSRRVEALQHQADALGEGNLSARVAVTGCDEIAELAHSFNRAAERIETLVNSQRAMLASASHELRSPLARIRMASSLIGDERPDLQDQIARDIAELDALIGDLLLASRLSCDAPSLKRESVDLLGMAAEEARRVDAELSGEPTLIQADARLLRHLLRNLLENARRHGSGSPISISLRGHADHLVLRVCDRGPGIPESERERIFEPFYRLPGSAESGEGSGYGLALVRRIARLHDGDVVCQAHEGGGACFETRLPL